MAQLYITDNKASLGIDGGRITVKYGDGMLRSLPLENVEGITIIGNAQLTTYCIGECLRRGIAVQYYSSKGSYFGKISSTQHVNTMRQRKQIELTKDEKFIIGISKNIVEAKVNNQIVLLRRYQRTSKENVDYEISQMKNLTKKIKNSNSLNQILGYEGNSARLYFKSLSTLVNNLDFKFVGRNRRPPKDAFNSILSLGYAILMNEVYGAIESRGLNPYFAFIHQDRHKHPTLASDLMEEWRPVLIDSIAMSMVNGNEINIDDFYHDNISGGVYLTKEGLKKFIIKLEKKFNTSIKYLDYLDYSISFRRAIDNQVLQLCKAIEEDNYTIYSPVKIR